MAQQALMSLVGILWRAQNRELNKGCVPWGITIPTIPLVSFLVTLISPAYGDAGVDIQQILQAWQKREEVTRSLTCSWKAHHMVASGYLTVPGTNISVPPTDTDLDSDGKLTIAGSKLRVEATRFTWRETVHRFVAQPYKSAFNGEVNKFYYAPAPGGTKLAEASLEAKGNVVDTRDMSLLPLFWCYRMFDPLLSKVKRTDFVLTDERVPRQSRSCLVLKGPEATYKRTYWVEESQGFPIVRFEETDATGQSHFTIDVTYDGSEDGVSRIRSWIITRTKPDGAVRTRVSLELTKLALNAPARAEDFELDFPPASFVRDESTRSLYMIDGEGRPRNLTVEDLEGRKDPDAVFDKLGESKPTRLPTFLLVNIVLVVIVGTLVLLRFWARKAAPTS